MRLGFFDAFYFMSYTATTIGFGELPQPFTDAQRMWVIICDLPDGDRLGVRHRLAAHAAAGRAFRQALALQQFTPQGQPAARAVPARSPGYGQTGAAARRRRFDELGRRLVVIDQRPSAIDALDLGAYRADVPGLVADVRNPHDLRRRRADAPAVQGVLALTDDDEANLAVTVMAAALLRPELPVIARTVSPAIAHRMRAFGTPTVVNPFDRFGDHLLLALRAPATVPAS